MWRHTPQLKPPFSTLSLCSKGKWDYVWGGKKQLAQKPSCRAAFPIPDLLKKNIKGAMFTSQENNTQEKKALKDINRKLIMWLKRPFHHSRLLVPWRWPARPVPLVSTLLPCLPVLFATQFASTRLLTLDDDAAVPSSSLPGRQRPLYRSSRSLLPRTWTPCVGTCYFTWPSSPPDYEHVKGKALVCLGICNVLLGIWDVLRKCWLNEWASEILSVGTIAELLTPVFGQVGRIRVGRAARFCVCVKLQFMELYAEPSAQSFCASSLLVIIALGDGTIMVPILQRRKFIQE